MLQSTIISLISFIFESQSSRSQLSSIHSNRLILISPTLYIETGDLLFFFQSYQFHQ